MISAEKPQEIKTMFASIAHRYDLLNHILSLSIDRYWRRCVVRELRKLISRTPVLALDLCCGTADLALTLSPLGKVVGCDFCHPMLARGNMKLKAKNKTDIIFLVEGDALNLPFPNDSFDVVTVAFGLRNLANPRTALIEMHRILRRGGAIAILEFSKPSTPALAPLFNFYFHKVVPKIGRLISKQNDAYDYLPTSASKFLDQESLSTLMTDLGFQSVRFRNLTGGISALHVGVK